ncbi:transcriptional regulator, LytTR family [Lachnospiraceae bacterium G41]|nr:transcriptional regulator, LytTR family [Lachnospiraceae bacterium G41]
MRVEIINNQTTESVNVEIHCKDITDEVKRLKRHIDNFSTGISGTEDGNTYIVSPNEIFYIESVDKKTFIYTEDKVLSTDKRLYELEEILDNRDFFRCSKSVIININKVVKLKPEITRNILATLSNNEVVVISRRYATNLKKLLGIRN